MIDKFKDIIQIDQRKGTVGIVLAILVFIFGCLLANFFIVFIFSALFILVGYSKLNINIKKNQYVANLIWGLIVILTTWLVSVMELNVLTDFRITPYKLLLNFLCIFILIAFFYILTANVKFSVTIASFILVILSTANGFIYQFRGKELAATDFLSIATAAKVADQYQAVITPSMVCGWFLWLLIIFIQFSLPSLPSYNKMRSRVVTVVVTIVSSFILYVGAADIPIKNWSTRGTTVNGYYLNFLLGIRDSAIKLPENYNANGITVLANKHSQKMDDEKSQPNIIVIMSESFADFRVLGNQLSTNIPVTPFIDSLEENTIKGYALSSVFGGNTANSEFEFLTGHSMAFFPDGSVPYQQYITGNTYSFAWYMNSLGYKCISTHPYFADGWSRTTIYPYIGFSESTFIDNYPAENLVREYISDQEMFEYIMNIFNKKEAGDPLFLFGISMQNHGGYTYDGEDFTQTVELIGYERKYPKAEQYLSLINQTDSAVEYLISCLKDYPEDTIVLFFGDHYPQVENRFYEEVHGSDLDTLPEQMLKYVVPFFIWANFDIEEQKVECTSLNYLSRYLLEASGFDLSPYYSFLKKLEKEIPAINAFGYYSISNQEFVPIEEAPLEEKTLLNQYYSLQYNNIFDTKDRDPLFFEQYIPAEQTQ